MFPIPAPISLLIIALAGTLLGTPAVMWGARVSLRDAGWRWAGWRTPLHGLGWGLLLGVLSVAWLRYLLHTGNYLPIPVTPTLTEWLLLALAVPVAEELCFRGAIFGALQRGWQPFWAVVLSALIYVTAHAADPWLAFIFLTGAGYALAFRLSGSVFSPMLAHGLVVAALLAARCAPQMVMASPTQPYYLAVALAVLLIGVTCVKNAPEARHKAEE